MMKDERASSFHPDGPRFLICSVKQTKKYHDMSSGQVKSVPARRNVVDGGRKQGDILGLFSYKWHVEERVVLGDGRP